MDLYQITGLVLFAFAFAFYILVLVLKQRRLNFGFPAIFGSIFFALAGIFMAATGMDRNELKLNLVNTVNAKSDSLVFLDGIGLIRGISMDAANNGHDLLYLNFKSTTPWADLGASGGINALAASNGSVYISLLLDTTLLMFRNGEIVELGNLPGLAPNLAVLDDAERKIFSTVHDDFFPLNILRLFVDQVAVNGTVQPLALCIHHSNLYISDNTRVLVMRNGKFIRSIGPLPPARRMQIWQDRYLVIVPLRKGSRTQIFTLDGEFLISIPGSNVDLAVSAQQLFLTDDTTICIYELG